MRFEKLVGPLVLPVLWCAVNSSAFAAPLPDFTDADRAAVEDVLLRQAAAASAHDIVAFEQVLVPNVPGQQDPVAMVARAYQFWGRAALIDHFKEVFKGVWKFEPDIHGIKVVPLTPDVAQIYAPTKITFGTSDTTATTAPFLMYEVAIRTPGGWRIASIVPVPAR
nr:nuclear transport factor 2 family protein [Caballeronia zhejiangensis]